MIIFMRQNLAWLANILFFNALLRLVVRGINVIHREHIDSKMTPALKAPYAIDSWGVSKPLILNLFNGKYPVKNL